MESWVAEKALYMRITGYILHIKKLPDWFVEVHLNDWVAISMVNIYTISMWWTAHSQSYIPCLGLDMHYIFGLWQPVNQRANTLFALFTCTKKNMLQHYLALFLTTDCDTWVGVSHKPKASENTAQECNNCDVHINNCNKVFIIFYHSSVMPLLTQGTK